jgi:hypothetical protein
MKHLPAGFLPWSELYCVRRINFGPAVPVASTINQNLPMDIVESPTPIPDPIVHENGTSGGTLHKPV